ncbi:MAG TPA: FAD-binding oxidoreductase [Yinghuangia sp.]|uniref:FAD-binding oxidoreductase n=1 Tax=Yinghuangia sp. YIM S10712 TaxID=3436930 RepID=UPI002C790762|nr:FAD-binding oxidoreductase [Yinghuangia sp.]
MARISRRGLLAGAGGGALALTAASTTALAGPSAAADAPAQDAALAAQPDAASITPGDPRYADITTRGYNKRFVAVPERVRIPGCTAHVVRAVQEAVDAGKRIAIRSGGHCLEGIVDDPAVKVIIDFTEMRAVTFDPLMSAFAVEPGATLGTVYRTLDYRWGVTLPGGVCPLVGAGGHIVGNGFGALSRQHGLIADHLYAIEIVVVDASGTAKSVVATRNSWDPNRELWWAHTGGGGGHFGVVTKFWMRSPNATGSDPARLLPPIPKALMTGRAVWNWSDLGEAAFVQAAKNFGEWMEANSAPGSATNAVHGAFSAPRKERGQVMVVGQLDPSVPGNEAVLNDYLAAMGRNGVPRPQIVKSGVLPWLTTTINAPDSSVAQGVLGPPRWKSKVGLLKKKYSDDVVSTAYGYLTRSDYTHPAAGFSLTTYGGQTNALAPDATATPHRSAIMAAGVFNAWDVPADDARHVEWNASFYRDLYAATGGAPVPNDVNDGCLVNWPDLDMADPALNSSGVPWSTLAYKENYPRLQRIKAKYDPLNVFRHALSITAP